MDSQDMEKVYLHGLKSTVKHNLWDVLFKYVKDNQNKYTDDQKDAMYDLLDVITNFDVDYKGE